MAHRLLISIAAALLAGVLYSYGADSQTAPASASIANDMLSRDVLRGLKQIENGLRLTGELGINPFGSPKIIQKVVRSHQMNRASGLKNGRFSALATS